MVYCSLALYIIVVIIQLCFTRSGPTEFMKFDCLKSILKAVQTFQSRPASRPVMFCVEKVGNKDAILENLTGKINIINIR